MIRKTCLFSGMVQGVGFRYTAQAIARQFAVSGYVRNLADGRVELLAEGDADEIARFIAAVQQQMSGYIREIDCAESAATGEFGRLEIRH